jgi:hypothetical protein
MSMKLSNYKSIIYGNVPRPEIQRAPPRTGGFITLTAPQKPRNFIAKNPKMCPNPAFYCPKNQPFRAPYNEEWLFALWASLRGLRTRQTKFFPVPSL